MEKSFGSLFKFPPEIREHIFLELISIRSINLMFASRALYIELRGCLRKRFILTLQISPSIQKSQIRIVRSADHEWGDFRNKIRVVLPHLHRRHNYLAAMPLRRFKELRILIDAPCPKDPGQMVRLHKEISELVTILKQRFPCKRHRSFDATGATSRHGCKAITLPPITIVLRNTATAAWSTRNSWNTSLSRYADDSSDYREHLSNLSADCDDTKLDVGLALRPFLKLRRAKSVKIVLADDPPLTPSLVRLIADIETLSTSAIPHGLVRTSPNRRDATPIHMLNPCNFIWLERLLKYLPGKSAASLRDEQLERWVSQREAQKWLLSERLVSRRDNTSADVGSGDHRFWPNVSRKWMMCSRSEM